MDRINSASKEVDKFGSGKHGFTDGDPADPSSGTLVNEDFMDGVQEELLAIIETNGATPSVSTLNQVVGQLILNGSSAPAANRTMSNTLLFDVTDDEQARISETGAVAAGDYRLLIQSGDIRLYASDTQVAFSHQATYNNTTNAWAADGASPKVIVHNLFGQLLFLDGSASFKQFTHDINRYDIFGVVETGGTPSTVYDGSGLINGNPSTPTTTTLAVDLDVTFTSTTTMSVIAQCDQAAYSASAAPTSTSRITIAATNTNTGALLDLDANTVKFHFQLRGY